MAKKTPAKKKTAAKAASEGSATTSAAGKKKAATKAKKKGTKKKAVKKKKTAPASKRVKLVWKVFNSGFKEVASFPYPERKDADATAAKLTKKSGQDHFVDAVKVPMEDDE